MRRRRMTEKHDSRTEEEEEGESLGLFGVHISSAAHTPYSYDISGSMYLLFFVRNLYALTVFLFFFIHSPDMPTLVS